MTCLNYFGLLRTFSKHDFLFAAGRSGLHKYFHMKHILIPEEATVHSVYV